MKSQAKKQTKSQKKPVAVAAKRMGQVKGKKSVSMNAEKKPTFKEVATASRKEAELTAGKISKDIAKKNSMGVIGEAVVVGVQRKVLKQIVHHDLTIVFDTETTGLINNSSTNPADQPRCIEFAGIKYDGKKEVERLTFLVQPGFALPDVIIKITGITDEMLKDQPQFPSYIPALQDFCHGVRKWVGQNIWFDIDILYYELMRYGSERKFPWPSEPVDTIDLSMSLKGHKLKLIELYQELFGESFVAHRAMSDTEACSRCYWELLKRA